MVSATQLSVVPHDERMGMPSASGIARILKCPASLALTRQLSENGQLPEDIAGAAAERGTRIHAMLACLGVGMDVEDAKTRVVGDDEADEAMALWERAQNVITRVFGTADGDEVIRVVEDRLWYYHEGTRLFSGQFDLAVLDTKSSDLVLIDYKTGRGDVPEAENNAQLAAGAVLFAAEHGITRSTVAILQVGERDSVAVLGPDEIERWRQRIVNTIAGIPSDPFVAGFGPDADTCKYCPVKTACPALSYQVTTNAGLSTDFIRSLDCVQLGEVLRRFETIKTVEEAARSEAERRISEGLPVDGWVMESGPPRRSVVDSSTMAQRLIECGASVPDVLAKVKLSVGDCEKLHQTASGLKGKAAKEAFAEICAGIVESKTPEPSLKEVKP